MNFGNLTFEPINEHKSLVAEPTYKTITALELADVMVATIDPTLADTAAFREQYGIG